MRIEIESIAAGGDGVGRTGEGLTVFVPRTAPGDVAEVEIVTRKPRWARARLSRLIAPGPGRVAPRCPHYVEDDCGGCQLQHLEPEVQHAAKRRIVGDALRRIGGVQCDDPPIRTGGAAWRYRRKVTFSVPVGDSLGYRRLGAPDEGFEVHTCEIADPRLVALWRDIREALRGMPGLDAVTLKVGESGLHVLLAGPTARDARTAATAAFATRDRAVTWWVHGDGRPVRAVAGPRAADPPTVFEQANPELADVIRADAVGALAPQRGEVVWDLYGGRGEMARLLSRTGARVWTVDSDRQAVGWGRRQVAGSDVTFVAGRVEDRLDRLPPADRVVVNPPRRGLGRAVTDALQGWAERLADAAPRLAYVSCDPATLARDLSRLPALSGRDVVTYDLFPQTSHVETLAVLGREPGGEGR